MHDETGQIIINDPEAEKIVTEKPKRGKRDILYWKYPMLRKRNGGLVLKILKRLARLWD